MYFVEWISRNGERCRSSEFSSIDDARAYANSLRALGLQVGVYSNDL